MQTSASPQMQKALVTALAAWKAVVQLPSIRERHNHATALECARIILEAKPAAAWDALPDESILPLVQGALATAMRESKERKNHLTLAVEEWPAEARSIAIRAKHLIISGRAEYPALTQEPIPALV